jgi:hypothetical protein
MNPHSGMNDNNKKNDNNNNRRIKAIAAISVAGIIVTAALLTGLIIDVETKRVNISGKD